MSVNDLLKSVICGLFENPPLDQRYGDVAAAPFKWKLKTVKINYLLILRSPNHHGPALAPSDHITT